MSNSTKKAAIYARTNTQGHNPETQLVALREYCHKLGYQITGEYVDIGFSGMDDERPELKRMLQDLRKSRFEIIVCFKLDRISRSTLHALQIIRELSNRNANLISITEKFDTSTNIGKATGAIMFALAEMERALFAERTKIGLERAKKRGRALGRPVGKKGSRKRNKSDAACVDSGVSRGRKYEKK